MPNTAPLPALGAEADARNTRALHIRLPKGVGSGQELVFRNAVSHNLNDSGLIYPEVLHRIAIQYTPAFTILPDRNLVLKVIAWSGRSAVVSQTRAGNVMVDEEPIHIGDPVTFMWGYDLNFDIGDGATKSGTMVGQVDAGDDAKVPDRVEIPQLDEDAMSSVGEEAMDQPTSALVVVQPHTKTTNIPSFLLTKLGQYKVPNTKKDLKKYWLESAVQYRKTLGTRGSTSASLTLGSSVVRNILDSLEFLPGNATEQFQEYRSVHESTIASGPAPGWLLIGLWWKFVGKSQEDLKGESWSSRGRWLAVAIPWGMNNLGLLE